MNTKKRKLGGSEGSGFEPEAKRRATGVEAERIER